MCGLIDDGVGNTGTTSEWLRSAHVSRKHTMAAQLEVNYVEQAKCSERLRLSLKKSRRSRSGVD